MSNKKAPLWYRFFYGKKQVNYYDPYPRSIIDPDSAWGIICCVVRPLIRNVDMLTLALIILKIIKSVDASWSLILLPWFIGFIAETTMMIVNYIVSKCKNKLIEDQRNQDKYYNVQRVKNTQYDAEEET